MKRPRSRPVVVAVYYSPDGGEWIVWHRRDGWHVEGPYTADSMGCWATEERGRAALLALAPDGTSEQAAA